MARPLPRRFYERPTVQVARELLGCEIRVQREGVVARGRIVETEAYRGFDDQACHGWRGMTPRLRSLFGPAGRAFVYLTRGVHVMFNVVTEERDFPSGVLIRAVEPLEQVEGDTRGPGLLTKALGIDRMDDGASLATGRVRLDPGGARPPERIGVSTRVGVEYSGAEAAARPWRFYLANNAYVSRGKPTDPERSAELLARRQALASARPRRPTTAGASAPRRTTPRGAGVRGSNGAG